MKHCDDVVAGFSTGSKGISVPDISIVICTLRRLQQLREALLSCLALRSQDHFSLEIIVVDNSPEAGAADLVKLLAAEATTTLRYMHEPRTNIAYARNTGIAASQAPFIAFVDDDMRLSPQWLRGVMCTMVAQSADALVGAIEPIPEHPDQAPDARILNFYCRDLELPEGGRIKCRRSGYISGVGTGNSVFRCATCIISSQPFDPAFGGGGEDTDFFFRLGQRKMKVVWSAESLAYEIVSPRRATLSFVTHRAFHGSQNYARAVVKNSRRRLLTALILTGIGGVQGIWHISYYAVLRLLHSEAAQYSRLFAIVGFGKIPWLSHWSSWWEMTR
jgi:succinoglycan biosynthesis protein ExoM